MVAHELCVPPLKQQRQKLTTRTGRIHHHTSITKETVMILKIFISLCAAAALVVIGMQVDRPAKNDSNDQSKHFSTMFPLPDSVQAILTVACYDCHSNNTRYPWYAEVQPVGQWIDDHIRHGKKDLNFSEFASYRPRRQYIKIEQIEEMVSEQLMPIPDYLRMHDDARLTDAQKQTLFAWVKATRDSMKHFYHPDSLKGRPRQ